MSSEKQKKYRVIKEFFVDAKDEFEAEKKANYKELQSILIDVQEVVDDWEFDDFPLTTNGEENVKRTNKQR
jgi:hypothetical protein